MEIKEKLEELVKKISSDKELQAKFKTTLLPQSKVLLALTCPTIR